MVVIGASGTPAVLPARNLVERGYKGSVYFNHGVANNDFLRVGGKDIEGMFVPTSPVVVAAALPADHPAKAVALDYVQALRGRHGAGTRLGLRLVHLGRLARAEPGDSGRAEEGRSRERASSGSPCARRSRTSATCTSRTASSACRRTTTSVSTSGRGSIVKVEGNKWKLD